MKSKILNKIIAFTAWGLSMIFMYKFNFSIEDQCLVDLIILLFKIASYNIVSFSLIFLGFYFHNKKTEV